MKRIFISLVLAYVLLLLTFGISAAPRVSAQVGPDIKVRGMLVDIWHSEDYNNWIFDIIVTEVLMPVPWLPKIEERYPVTYSRSRDLGQIDWSVYVGDQVEVYAEWMDNCFHLKQPYHYLKKIGGGPADLVVYQCGVSPSNPKQEDLVTFYAIIANIGGSDAYNFRLDLYLSFVEGWYPHDSGYLSLRAGEKMQVWSDKPWVAEDGQYSYRWVVNPDKAIQESNYGNNECGGSFIVSPRTVTLTEYITITGTKTQTEKITLTTTATTYKGALTTHTVTRTITVTGKAFTTTMSLTGLYTRTYYSPTITVTVTAQAASAQASQLPLLISITALLGAIIHQRRVRGRWRKKFGEGEHQV